MDYSLIVATKGRFLEISFLLKSVYTSMSDCYTYEVILVDQNPLGYLASIIDEFSYMPIVHIVSKSPGLSLNRNIGLKYAKGDVICFPDDDCMFYEDTFTQVSSVFDSTKLDFCIGRIYDRENKKDIIKKWPASKFNVGRFNSYFINSSITMFFRRAVVLDFDENLGVGALYGSCEDADFLYRVINSGAVGIYTPVIEVWHPDVDMQDIPLDKVRKYASGFGYFVGKNLDLTKTFLLFLLLVKKFVQLFRSLFGGRFKLDYFKSFFGGLLDGLFRKLNVD